MVVVDTAIWIDHFAGRRSDYTEALDYLVRRRRALINGVILAELLRGRPSPEERLVVEDRLTGVGFLDMTRATWRTAGAIAGDLDRRGERIPEADAFIAASALEGDHELLTRDKHFERIPGLRLYKWEDADA